MKTRRVLIILVFLLAGAITTIAVAAVCSLLPLQQGFTGESEEVSWPAFVAAPPTNAAFLHREQGFGVDTTTWWSPVGRADSVTYRRTRAGWPLRTFSCEWGWEVTAAGGATWLHWRAGIEGPTRLWSINGRSAAEVLPYGPIWPALIANTLIYAAALFALTAALRTGVRRARVKLRLRRGRCIACGYAVRALPTCPECGQIRPE